MKGAAGPHKIDDAAVDAAFKEWDTVSHVIS